MATNMSWQDMLRDEIKKSQTAAEKVSGPFVISLDNSGHIPKETMDIFFAEMKRIHDIFKFKWKSWLYFNRHNSKQEGHPLHCSLCKERFDNRNR